MNPLAEVGLIVGRELRKNFRSIKGLILCALALLGGFGTTMLLLWVEKMKRQSAADLSLDQLHAIREAGLSKVYGEEQGKYLADAPEVLLLMLLITIWVGPLFIALMGFDGISGELQHRSVRYWTVRTRRASFYVGKFVGSWAVVSTVTFALNLVVWIATMARGEATLASCVSWGLRFWLVSLPIGAAWCGIATLVASQFRTPMLSLLVTFAAFFVIWLVYVIGGVTGRAWMMHIYPNYYDVYLLSPKLDQFAKGLGACLGFAGATTALGAYVFTRRDL